MAAMGQFPLHKDIFIRLKWQGQQATVRQCRFASVGWSTGAQADATQERQHDDHARISASGTARSPSTCREQFDAGLYFIGRIRTPWKRAQGLPEERPRIRRGLHHRGRSALGAGLKDVETCSHLVVLYWMDKSRRDLVLQVPGHYGVQRGTFALRSPARPNPIAMSVVRLLSIDGNRLSVVGLDCLDGTPLLDLKPYFASTDACPTPSSAGTSRSAVNPRPRTNIQAKVGVLGSNSL